MCTLTWRPSAERGYDLFFNRDELDTRTDECPPAVITTPGGRVIAPRDGPGGGTWLALNEQGVTLALLNCYPSRARAGSDWDRPTPSRGGVCWTVAGARSAREAIERVKAGAWESAKPFHLVALDAEARGEWRTWDGAQWSGGSAPLFLTSSSFASSEIEAERARRWRTSAPVTVEEMEAFHWFYEPAAGAASICMRRADARTRSVSHITVRTGLRSLKYWAVGEPGAKPAEGQVVEL
ncbi:MAG: NRDE family protein [Opitutaceae bacterium]